MDITITGIDEVCAYLDKLPQQLAKKAFARALTAATVPIVEALEVETPVDKGLLKSSIVTDVAIDNLGKGGRAQVGFGKDGFVARMVEYGHQEIGHLPNKVNKGGVSIADPFMRRAAADSLEKALEAFQDSVKETIESGV